MFLAGMAYQGGEGDWQNLSKQQPAAPGDGAIYPRYSIQLQLAPPCRKAASGDISFWRASLLLSGLPVFYVKGV